MKLFNPFKVLNSVLKLKSGSKRKNDFTSSDVIYPKV